MISMNVVAIADVTHRARGARQDRPRSAPSSRLKKWYGIIEPVWVAGAVGPPGPEYQVFDDLLPGHPRLSSFSKCWLD